MIEAIVFFFLFTTIVHRAASGRWFWQPTWIVEAYDDFARNEIRYHCVDRRVLGPLSHPLREISFSTREAAQQRLDEYLGLIDEADRINKGFASSTESWPKQTRN